MPHLCFPAAWGVSCNLCRKGMTSLGKRPPHWCLSHFEYSLLQYCLQRRLHTLTGNQNHIKIYAIFTELGWSWIINSFSSLLLPGYAWMFESMFRMFVLLIFVFVCCFPACVPASWPSELSADSGVVSVFSNCWDVFFFLMCQKWNEWKKWKEMKEITSWI